MYKLILENINIAFDAIRTQLLRTMLTVLIIAIGITALVGILTVVSALENTLSSNFASMGSNTFSINQNTTRIRSHGHGRDASSEKVNPIITYSQVRHFKENYDFPFAQTSVSFTASTRAEVKYETEKTDPEISIVGVDEYFLSNSGSETHLGRNFSSFDINNQTFCCIVGSDFEKGLLKDVNPIGKNISIRGAKFKVIGVLKEKGATFGNKQDLRVLIPIGVARSLFSAPSNNYDLSIKVAKEVFLDEAIGKATVLMRNIRKLPPVKEDDFGISRSDDLIHRISELTGVLSMSAWLIGIITIFGSSIALMNIMLVSVTERTREIGVRKALGAKRSTIAMQFFIETLIIGKMGGILGIILGILIGYGISMAIEFEFVIPWGAVMAAFATTFLVALVSGSYPALKASKLDPIEALRYE